MRASIFLGLLLVSCVVVSAQQHPNNKSTQAKTVEGAKLQPLNIKTGLWEVSYTRSSNGEMPIPAEYASRLTPEQRARFEENMKKSSTRTHKSCVKPEDIDGSLLNSREDRDCKVTILKSTSTEVAGKMACEIEGMHGDGNMTMQAIDSEHTKGVTHMTLTGNGKTLNTDATITSKWIGADCKGVN